MDDDHSADDSDIMDQLDAAGTVSDVGDSDESDGFALSRSLRELKFCGGDVGRTLDDDYPGTTLSGQPVRWVQRPITGPDVQSVDATALAVGPPPMDKRPIDYFAAYFDDGFFDAVADYTNLYAAEKGLADFAPTSGHEIKKFVACNLVMGCARMPILDWYWKEGYESPLISQNMTRDRFFQIRDNLHVADNRDVPADNRDKFVKIRPLYDLIKRKCNELPKERDLSVGERVVPVKGEINAQLNLKYYKKGKRCPWAIKMFVLAGNSGMVYDFLIHQENSAELDRDERKLVGHAGAVVLHLVRTVKPNAHFLYFNADFTSYPLLERLRDLQIYAVGKVKADRFGQLPLLSDKDIIKKGGGSSCEISSDVENACSVSMVKWYFNKPITMASNFVGIGNLDEIKVYETRLNSYVFVQRPEIMRLYYEGIGGVRKSNKFITSHQYVFKCRKWTSHLIVHAFNLVACNAWLQYIRDADEIGAPPKDKLKAFNFRLQLAQELIYGKENVRKRTEGSSSDSSSDETSNDSDMSSNSFNFLSDNSQLSSDSFGSSFNDSDDSDMSSIRKMQCEP